MPKSALRAHMHQRSLEIDFRTRKSASEAVARHLLQHIDSSGIHPQQSLIAIFRSFSDEIDLTYFEQGLTLRNIPCEVLTEKNTPSIAPALIIVPGIAFDESGRRLGRGRGYYDRLLSELKMASPELTSIGVAYDHQLVDTVPTQAHDHVVDMLCLPSTGLFRRRQEK